MCAVSAPLSPEVVDPADVGIDPARIEELAARVREEVGGPGAVLPNAAVAVARHGRLVCNLTVGAPAGARFNLFSVTKAFIAALAWRVISEGALFPATRVAELVPEFATNGKDVITVEHLLTHTGGFPTAPLGPPDWYDRVARLERFARWRLNWEPGSRMEYHPSSAHWVLAEILERIEGRDYRDALFERVFEPLGLPRLRVGATARHPDDWADVPPIEVVGEPPTPAEFEAMGLPPFDLGEITDEATLRFNLPEVRALGVPGGGGIGSPADVALFYQALLHNAGDLWDPSVLADGTGAVRVTDLDPLLGVPANRTLGLIVAGDDGMSARRGFGKTVSARAFGHLGAGAQVAWADPATGLSFCFATQGHDAHLLREGRRINALNNRAGALVDH